jgi:catechol O-methyltransferase
LADYVVANARRGDPEDVIWVIDEFCMNRSVMINVGDEKGEILDRAVRRASPQLLLELGTYCGYSALRMGPRDARRRSAVLHRVQPGQRGDRPPHLGSRRNRRPARRRRRDARRWRIDNRPASNRARFRRANVDFVFLDHDKDVYLPDLERVSETVSRRPVHRLIDRTAEAKTMT